MADAPLTDPTCAELKTAYLNMVLAGGEVLIKAGDQLVKYTDAALLLETIEKICGPITPDGSTAQRGMKFRVARINNKGCGGGCR